MALTAAYQSRVDPGAGVCGTNLNLSPLARGAFERNHTNELHPQNGSLARSFLPIDNPGDVLESHIGV